MQFDSDSINLYIDSYVTGGLIRFKDDFIQGSYANTKERSSDTTSSKATIISKGLIVHILKNNNGKPYTLQTKMTYSSLSKFRLMALQQLGTQEKDHVILKEKQFKYNINNEEVVLLFSDYQHKVIIKHNPEMLVPILNINLGIKKLLIIHYSILFCYIR